MQKKKDFKKVKNSKKNFPKKIQKIQKFSKMT